jgi:hypothetical protein
LFSSANSQQSSKSSCTVESSESTHWERERESSLRT